jgi:hypothetical protein
MGIWLVHFCSFSNVTLIVKGLLIYCKHSSIWRKSLGVYSLTYLCVLRLNPMNIDGQPLEPIEQQVERNPSQITPDQLRKDAKMRAFKSQLDTNRNDRKRGIIGSKDDDELFRDSEEIYKSKRG